MSIDQLTEKQKNWIITNFKNTKNDVIMQKTGITHSSLHRFARANGLKKTPQFQKKCQRAAAAAARAVNQANNWPPKGYIIPKSENNRFKPGITPQERLGKRKNEKRILKSAESRSQTVASEKRRVLFGLPQKTKLKVVPAPPGKASFRHTMRKRGYIIARGGKTVYYDESTNRSEKTEKTAKEKYYLKVAMYENSTCKV